MPITNAGAIESIKLTKDQRERLIKQIRGHYDDATAARGDWATRHDRRYRRYLADPTLRPMGPWPNAPRLFTSHTRRVTDKILSEIWTGIFPDYESVELVPFDEAALPKLALANKTHQWVLQHLINEADKGGWSYISYMCLFDALLDSTGFLKIYPWRPPWKNAIADTIIRIDNIDEETLLIPPGATGTQYPDAEYFGQELRVRWDDLMRMKRQGFSVPAWEEFPCWEQDLSEAERTKQERDGRQAEPDQETRRAVELYERFVFDKKTDEEDDIIVSWYPDCSDEHCLGRVLYIEDLFPNQPAPLRPFFGIPVWPQPRQLRGLNVPDRAETPQDLINRLAEQMVNYGDVSILPYFFYNALITGDIPDLRQVMPGQGVPVNDLGGIQQVQRPSLNRHFQEGIQGWGADIEADLHVSDISLGRQATRPNAPRTLGGTQLLLQQGREAFSILVKLLAPRFGAVLDFHWRLWQYYVPPGLLIPAKPQRQVLGVQGMPGDSPFFNAADPFASPGSTMGGLAGSLNGMHGTNGVSGIPGMNGAPEPGGMNSFTGEGMPLADVADYLREPQAERLLAQPVTKEDLAGTFLVQMHVNPDLPFDRQMLTQLGQMLVPMLQPLYPIGARLLMKRVWEVNGQTGFDELYPPAIALMQTQMLFQQILQQQQMQQMAPMLQSMAAQQQQGQPQGEAPPSPETQAMLEAGQQHGAHQDANQAEARTQQAQLATAQAGERTQQARLATSQAEARAQQAQQRHYLAMLQQIQRMAMAHELHRHKIATSGGRGRQR